MAKTKKKNGLFLLLLILLLSITVGYAAFAQTLYINGTANARGNFKLKFDEANLDSAVGADGTVSINGEDDTLAITVNLDYPGANAVACCMVFNLAVIKAKVKNSGSIPAQLKSIDILSGDNDPDIKINYTLGEVGDVIQPNDTKDVYITVTWDEQSSVSDKFASFSAKLNYEQYTVNNTNTNTNTNTANNG